MLIVAGVHPCRPPAPAFVAGRSPGATTGVLHTRFRINGLLSGILVMTALYSINLHVMGKSNLPLCRSARSRRWRSPSARVAVGPGRIVRRSAGK